MTTTEAWVNVGLDDFGHEICVKGIDDIDGKTGKRHNTRINLERFLEDWRTTWLI